MGIHKKEEGEKYKIKTILLIKYFSRKL